MPLSEIIIDRIRNEGPISFRDFMEMSLYYPGHGYYMSDRDKIGRNGDFYTSAYLTSLFGKLIAAQLEEMWHTLGRGPFTIVECGAGTGLLCSDILHTLKENRELNASLEYYIIEKSGTMREKQSRVLPQNVRRADSLEEIPPVTGCIFSNELVDNFSVHQVVMRKELMEVFVDYRDGFTELLRPAPDTLKEYLRQLQISLPEGFRTEINWQAVEWIGDISKALHKGYVMTIDYGCSSSILYSQQKKNGTLACYHRHSQSDCPYVHVGDQDITADVNFSAIHRWGQDHGLECCGYTNQAFFLQGLGLARVLRDQEEKANARAPADQERLLLNTFLLEMGRKFKVLIQGKGIHPRFLSGLRFAQPSV